MADRIPPFGLTFGIGIHTCFGRDIAGGLGQGKDPSQAPHYGTLTNLLKSLLQHHARQDPGNPPVPDAATERPTGVNTDCSLVAPFQQRRLDVTEREATQADTIRLAIESEIFNGSLYQAPHWRKVVLPLDLVYHERLFVKRSRSSCKPVSYPNLPTDEP